MTQQTQAGPRRSFDGVFAAMRGLGIQRNTDDRWLAGVCSGLANRFGVDPLLARGILIVLVSMGGIGVLAYLVAWALLPDRDGRILAEAALRGDGRGIGLLVVIGIVLVSRLVDRWWVWLVLVPLALLTWWGVQSSRSGKTPEQMSEEAARFAGRVAAPFTTPPAPAPGAPSAPATTAPAAAPHGMGPGRTGTVVAPDRVIRHRRPRGGFLALLATAGLAVAGYGLGSWYATRTGFPGTSPGTFSETFAGSPQLLAAGFALAGAGLALLVIGLTGRRAGFTTFLVTLAATGVVAATAAPPLPPGGLGEREWVALSQPSDGFTLTAGDAKLTLADAPTGSTVRVAVGFGQLRVAVPKDTTATFTTSVRAGQVVVTHADGTKSKLGGTQAGGRQTVTAGTGAKAVSVDATMVAGEILVTEEPS